MENSVFSSPSRKPSLPKLTVEDDRSSEESGWTEYLADFSAYNRGERDDDEDNVENSSFVISESMVSDAGSGPEWRQRNSNSNINNNNHSLTAGVWSSFDGLPNVPKKLNFKKKRTQEISHDDSLEDTASSPVDSPKVSFAIIVPFLPPAYMFNALFSNDYHFYHLFWSIFSSYFDFSNTLIFYRLP